MKYALKVDLPGLAGAKQLVEVPGLGAVINPGTYEVPDNRLAEFEQLHGYPLSEADFQEGIQLFGKDEETGEVSELFRTPQNLEEKTPEQTEEEFKQAQADNERRAVAAEEPKLPANVGGDPVNSGVDATPSKKAGDN
jgi:hypothetical protein